MTRNTLHVNMGAMVMVPMVMMTMVMMVMMVMIMVDHWLKLTTSSITVTANHPSTSPAPPALGHPSSHTVVTCLDRGSVRNLEVFLMILKQLVRLGSNVPWSRSRSILGAINQLACIWLMLPGSLPALGKRLQLVMECTAWSDVKKH